MRIVLVSPEYPPADRMGGIGTYTSTVAPELAKRGHDVHVVTRGEGAAFVDRGVSVIRLAPVGGDPTTAQRLLRGRGQRILARRRIAGVVAELRPDLVQAAEWEAEAWWLAAASGIPLVTRLATPTYLVNQLNGGPAGRENLVLELMERDQTRRSAAVFAPTRAIVASVSRRWRLPPGRVEVIPNPIDCRSICNAGRGPDPVGLPPKFIAFVGRIERRKGVETLGAALPAVLDAHPDLHVVLVGRDPGDEAGALTARFWASVEPVADRVHMLGELPREAALAVMARAQLVVVPSLWESFGFVCVEAMALGRPVVASASGGLAEIVEHGQTGWLVPPGDSGALAARLTGLMGDAAMLAHVGQAARKRSEDFEVGPVVESTLSVYERVLDGDHRFDRSVYQRGYRRHFRPDENAGPFHRLYEQKRRRLLDHLAVDQRLRLLDAGGGFGRLAAPLARSHDVTLCDIAPDMLEEAARSCPPGVGLVRADARRLPFCAGAYDAVVAADLVVHLPDLEDGVRELARVVRRGGRLLFDTTNASPWWVLAYPSYVSWRPRRMVRTIIGDGVLPEWQRVVRHHRADEVARAIQGAGLVLEDVHAFGPAWTAKWHLWIVRKP